MSGVVKSKKKVLRFPYADFVVSLLIKLENADLKGCFLSLTRLDLPFLIQYFCMQFPKTWIRPLRKEKYHLLLHHKQSWADIIGSCKVRH